MIFLAFIGAVLTRSCFLKAFRLSHRKMETQPATANEITDSNALQRDQKSPFSRGLRGGVVKGELLHSTVAAVSIPLQENLLRTPRMPPNSSSHCGQPQLFTHKYSWECINCRLFHGMTSFSGGGEHKDHGTKPDFRYGKSRFWVNQNPKSLQPMPLKKPPTNQTTNKQSKNNPPRKALLKILQKIRFMTKPAEVSDRKSVV